MDGCVGVASDRARDAPRPAAERAHPAPIVRHGAARRAMTSCGADPLATARNIRANNPQSALHCYDLVVASTREKAIFCEAAEQLMRRVTDTAHDDPALGRPDFSDVW